MVFPVLLGAAALAAAATTGAIAFVKLKKAGAFQSIEFHQETFPYKKFMVRTYRGKYRDTGNKCNELGYLLSSRGGIDCSANGIRFIMIVSHHILSNNFNKQLTPTTILICNI
jgi:hypothetical protein